mgnify:FL=1
MEAKIVCTCSHSYNQYKNYWNNTGLDFDYLSHKINDKVKLDGLVFTEENLRKDFDFDLDVSKKHYWNSFGNRNIVWFYAHLRMLYYYNLNPGYDYYWFFDDDLNVDNWEIFLKSFEKNNSDFISYYLFKEANVKSQPNIPNIDNNTTSANFWFERFPGHGDILYEDTTEYFGAFYPITRFSNNALAKLSEVTLQGLSGWHEGFVPTILNYHGFKLDTIFNNTSKSKYFDDDIVNVKHKHTKIHWSWI